MTKKNFKENDKDVKKMIYLLTYYIDLIKLLKLNTTSCEFKIIWSSK